MITNLFDISKIGCNNEISDIILYNNNIKIEKIISFGNSTDWYDQIDYEWVTVLQGYGIIEYNDNSYIKLNPGDSLIIPPHKIHRVKETANPTIWLAVFFTE